MSARPNKEDHGRLQQQAEHASPQKSSVLPYLVVLAAAAFLLLIMAYFMQQRTAQSVEGLNQSINTIQTMDQLVEENRSLRLELERVKAQLSAAEDQQARLRDQLTEAKDRLAQVQSQLDGAQQSPAP